MFQEAEWEWRRPNPVGAGLLEEVGLREPDAPDRDGDADPDSDDNEFAGEVDRERNPCVPARPGAWGLSADGKRRGEDEEDEFEEDEDVEEDEEFEEDEDLDEEFDDEELDEDEDLDEDVEEEGEEEDV